jgi:hypothetical protein
VPLSPAPPSHDGAPASGKSTEQAFGVQPHAPGPWQTQVAPPPHAVEGAQGSHGNTQKNVFSWGLLGSLLMLEQTGAVVGQSLIWVQYFPTPSELP